MSKRSAERRITMKTKTLAYLREKAGLSMRDAGKYINRTGYSINHIEHGRIPRFLLSRASKRCFILPIH